MRLLIIGGSDAGIAAALRARELDPTVTVTVLLADEFPNYSICGIPYYLSGEVPRRQGLAHRSTADLQAAGITLRLCTTAVHIVTTRRAVTVHRPATEEVIGYDRLIVAAGAVAQRPPIDGLDTLGPDDGLHLPHTIHDASAVLESLHRRAPAPAAVIGAGYVGLEMGGAAHPRRAGDRRGAAAAGPDNRRLRTRARAGRGAAPPPRGPASVHAGPRGRGGRRPAGPARRPRMAPARWRGADGHRGPPRHRARRAGRGCPGAQGCHRRGPANADQRRGVYAAGDCVVTHHRLLGQAYLPLGTTAHEQGRVAGQNAVGGDREFAGSLGTQVVRVFGLVAARTGLRDREARDAGFDPVTVHVTADDHKAYYPGARPVRVRLTVNRPDRRLLGVQMLGAPSTAVAKRIDTAATLHAGMTVDDLIDLDLSYTPPLGTPWDALQTAALNLDHRPRRQSPRPDGVPA